MGSFTMNQLRFLGQGVTLSGNAHTLGGTAPSVTMSNGGSATLGNAITLNAATTFNLGGALTLNGIVSGANALTKIGGSLSFGANNTFTGNTTLGSGTLAYSADNTGVKTLVLGASAGETLANTVNANANVTAAGVTVQTSNVTNTLNIAASKTVTVTSSWLQGGLNTTQAASHLRITGAGSFAFNNAAGTMTVRRGSILDLSGIANATITAATLNLGDIDNYTQASPATLIVSADGNTTIRANTINLDCVSLGGGGRGESASFIAPEGTGTLTIRNAAGTGPAALFMDKNSGGGSQASTTIFDTRGHYADISLSTLDIAHRTAAAGGASGLGYFYFDEGILNVSGVTWVATCDAGVQTNNAALEISGGTANFVGGMNLATSTTGRSVTAEFNVAGGVVSCGKISAAVATPGFVQANINVTGGTLTMTDDMVGGAVSGTVSGYASTGQARLIVDGGTLDMAGRAIGTAALPFSSVSFYSGTVRNVGSINGAAGFTKSAPGVLVIEGTNTYTGATTISSGELEVDGSIASTAAMTISSGATLSGTGSITSPVTISGILAPGIYNIGTLTIGNSLTLNSGSTTQMVIDRAGAANSSAVQGVSTLTYAGTLTVTNTGATLVDGDRFVLFGAGTYLGAFTNLNLPLLDAGLVWDTRALNVDGSVVVRATVGGSIVTAKYWDTSASAGLQGGSGSWDIATTSLWNTASNGSAAPTRFWHGDTAYFQNGVANNVTLSGLVAVDSLAQSVNGTSTTISGGTLLINGASSLSNGVGSGNGGLTINSNVVLNSLDVTMTAVQPITLNAGLSGAGDLTKSGSGALTLGASSPWAGALILDGGTVHLNGDALNLQGITYGATVASANASSLNLNGNVTLPTMLVQSTGSNALTIAAGKTLTINGAAIWGLNGNTTGTGSCTFTSSGAGTLLVNNPGGSFIVAGGKVGLTMTADCSNLNAMQVNLGTTGTFYLGVFYSLTSDTLRLAANTTINAATMSVGDANTGGTYTLQLGRGANVINANNFYVAQKVGNNNRSDASVKFDPADSTGTLRLRAADGIGRVNLTMNDSSSTTGRSLTSSFDVSGHVADLLLSNLIVGRRNGITSASTATTDTFKWDKGTLDLANMVLLETAPTANNKPCTGTMTLGSAASTALDTVNFANGIIIAQNLSTAASGSVANGTLNIAGGTVRMKNIVLGDLLGTVATRQSNATLNLTGGSLLMSGSIASGTSGGSGTLTSTFNLNGTALDMAGNSIGGLGLGSITNIAFQSGTLSNVSAINGTAGLTKTTAGKLTLGGTNTFTGPIAVNAGTLQLIGSVTAPINVASGATLIHGGTVSGDVTLLSGATDAPDTTSALATINGNYTLNTGATLRVRLNGSTAGTQHDQLVVSGNVTLGGAIEVVCGPNLAPGSTFRILDKAGSTTTATTFTGKAENSTFVNADGYTFRINYNSGTGNDVVLTLITTPIEQWRHANFGSIFNTGNAADMATPANDGVPNLLKYATRQSPLATGLPPQSVVRTGNALDFTFTKNKAATDVSFIVEWSNDLSPASWSSSGVSAPSVLSDDGLTQQMKVTVPAVGTRLFVRLKVTPP
jgi:autotransporter-associated beta strand protein